MTRRHYLDRSKVIFDFALALPLLVILTPVIFVVAAVIRLVLGSPVLFRQTRVGYGGKLFVIYKFRTMPHQAHAEKHVLCDREQLVWLSKTLRRTRLDELPQLVNVLRREMSLVGPRPLLPEYLDHYTKQQARRHDVLPGLTGWAQIHGGNNISWEQKFEYDIWYVEHATFSLDCIILGRTFVLLLRSLLRPQADEVASRFDEETDKADR
jgi:sugar transferase EpsL